MSRSNYKHAHKYEAVNQGLKVYRCTYTGCPHTIVAALLKGREAQCPKCEVIFTVNEDHLRRKVLGCIGECQALDPNVAKQLGEAQQPVLFDPMEALKKAGKTL